MEYDPDARHWSIVTKAKNGTVSCVRDLTLGQARTTYERLDPWYGRHWVQYVRDDGTKHFESGGSGMIFKHDNGGDIELRLVFGPPGWSQDEVRTWSSWPKTIEKPWSEAPVHMKAKV